MINKIIIYFLQVAYLMVIIDNIDKDNRDEAIQSVRDLGNILREPAFIKILNEIRCIK